MGAGFATSDCFLCEYHDWRSKMTHFKREYWICRECEDNCGNKKELQNRIDFKEMMELLGNPPYASA